MGFADNRYINKSTVNPGSVGAAPISQGNGFAKLASEFDAISSDLFASAEKEDKKRGTTLGENSVEIDASGNITRKPVDPSLETKVGREAFLANQNTSALFARKNAITAKGLELTQLYSGDPDGASKYAESMEAFLTPFFDDTNDDIRGLLKLGAADIVKKGVIKLSGEASDRQKKADVAAANSSIGITLANIESKSAAGQDASADLFDLEATIKIALETNLLLPIQVAPIMREAKIAEISGNEFRQILNETKDIGEVLDELRKKLWNPKGGKSPYGIDLKDEDKNAIYAKVSTYANRALQTRNLATAEETKVMGEKLFAIAEQADASGANGNIFDENDLTSALRAAGITREAINGNSMARSMVRSLTQQLSREEEVARNKIDQEEAFGILDKVENAKNAKESKQAWLEFQTGDEAGIYENQPSMRRSIQNAQVKWINNLFKDMTTKTEAAFDSKFNGFAFNGQLNGEILQKMSIQNTPQGKYVLKHRARIEGFIKNADTTGSKVRRTMIQADKNGGLNLGDKGKANEVITALSDNARRMGKADPTDPNTAEGQATLREYTKVFKLVPKKYADWLTTKAFSANAKDAAQAVALFDGMGLHKDGPQIRASLPVKFKARAIELRKYFLGRDPENQGDYDQFLKTFDVTDKQTQDRLKYAKSVSVERIGEIATKMFSDASNREFYESLRVTDLPGFHWLTYKFFPDKKSLPSEELIKRDAGGETAILSNDLAPLSLVVKSTMRDYFILNRHNYPLGDDGDKQAMEDGLTQLYSSRTIGPTNFAPRERDADGERVDGDGGLKFVLHPIENYLPSQEVGKLVEDKVRTYMSQPGIDLSQFPAVVRGWFLGDVLGFDSIMKDWVSLEANHMKTTKDQWSGSIIITDPDNPRANRITVNIDGDWTPTQLDITKLRAKTYRKETGQELDGER
mgnify:CR=1 FL=1